jgi:hypothetical protein
MSSEYPPEITSPEGRALYDQIQEGKREVEEGRRAIAESRAREEARRIPSMATDKPMARALDAAEDRLLAIREHPERASVSATMKAEIAYANAAQAAAEERLAAANDDFARAVRKGTDYAAMQKAGKELDRAKLGMTEGSRPSGTVGGIFRSSALKAEKAEAAAAEERKRAREKAAADQREQDRLWGHAREQHFIKTGEGR